jgi:hypothetical protein
LRISQPSIWGIMMSRTSRSGRFSRIMRMAVFPSQASSTSKFSSSRLMRTRRVTMGSSSTTRTR